MKTNYTYSAFRKRNAQRCIQTVQKMPRINAMLPAVRRFGGERAEKKAGVIAKLKVFFQKFMGLVEAPTYENPPLP